MMGVIGAAVFIDGHIAVYTDCHGWPTATVSITHDCAGGYLLIESMDPQDELVEMIGRHWVGSDVSVVVRTNATEQLKCDKASVVTSRINSDGMAQFICEW